jgi:two-component system, OmpR family, sensor histidine kinase CreC
VKIALNTPRNRIFLGIVIAYALGVGFLMWQLLKDIDPRYRESAEESLVETAHLMASVIEQQSPDNATIDVSDFDSLFRSVYARNPKATIFGFEKDSVELRLYVTDRRGIVLFDSMDRHVGEDYSRWRDVRLTLAGQYGARTSPDVDDDPSTSVMVVGAPIRLGNEIAGVVSVGKPVTSLNQFIQAARRKTLLVGLTSAAAALLFMLMLAVWLARPFGLVRDYLRYARAQRSFSLPRLSRRAMTTIATAYDEMRDALGGRNLVADHVQALTHELKSPLSAIRGAAELMQEPSMPTADRVRFLTNIQRETERIQETVDRMMELVALESRHSLEKLETVALRPLLDELAASTQAATAARGITVQTDVNRDAAVQGDLYLLRRAIGNLLDNARDFAPDGSTIELALAIDPSTATITVRDHGPGIPDYASSKVFDKFFSLGRPGSGKKSTGLGLPFVQEVVTLHDGWVTLENADGGGALARVVLRREG